MPTFSRSEIKNDISELIRKNGNKPGKWYVGFTEDQRQALLVDHNVDENSDVYLARPARNSLSAAKAVYHFRTKKGTLGDNVGGITDQTEALSDPDENLPDPDRTIVYAYKTSMNTDP